MKNSELHQRRVAATPRGVGVMCGFYAEKAENATLWDVEGNEVIDFAAAIFLFSTSVFGVHIIESGRIAENATVADAPNSAPFEDANSSPFLTTREV